ncbi:MAG: tetratricopeptide repeat protein [Parvibaculum sp.]
MTFIRMIFPGLRVVLTIVVAIIVLPHSSPAADLRRELLKLSQAPLAGNQSVFDEGTVAYEQGDYDRAYAIWMPQAKAGDLGAQRNVAHLLRRGLGTELDAERALYFYERAARAGLAGAALNAGMMRLEKDAPYFDTDDAAEWLSLAASAGSPIARWELGQLMERGDGLRQDKEGGLALIKAAADAGQEDAIAELRHRGILPPAPPPPSPQGPFEPDVGAAFTEGVYAFQAERYADAISAWSPLAEAGVREAQFRLAQIYHLGLGVPVDLMMARALYQKAALTEHEGAIAALVTLPPDADAVNANPGD